MSGTERLILSIATRGRPERITETVRRNLATAILPNTTLFLAVDLDDRPTIEAVEALRKEFGNDRIQVSVNLRYDTIAEKWNQALQIPATCYSALGDDDPIATYGWDEKLLEAANKFPDGLGIAYGHMANASFPSVAAWPKKFCEALGNKVFPEYFPYWFCD